MTLLIRTLAAVAAGTVLATSAFAQSAREIRGASPYDTIENEPAPKLIVDPPLPGPLAHGIFQAQYRVENVRILPVFGAGALNASPRLGHLHITVDDLPWLWADASDNNTVDIAGLPPGQHKVKIELVDANHKVFPGQVVTLTFTVPAAPSAPKIGTPYRYSVTSGGLISYGPRCSNSDPRGGNGGVSQRWLWEYPYFTAFPPGITNSTTTLRSRG